MKINFTSNVRATKNGTNHIEILVLKLLYGKWQVYPSILHKINVLYFSYIVSYGNITLHLKLKKKKKTSFGKRMTGLLNM